MPPREQCEAFLSRYPEEDQHRILRVRSIRPIPAIRMEDAPPMPPCGQKGQLDPEAGERQRGIEHKTIDALREIGVLDEIGETTEGLLVYPGAVIDEPPLRTVGIRGVWFNLHNARSRRRVSRPLRRCAMCPKPGGRCSSGRSSCSARPDSTTRFSGWS